MSPVSSEGHHNPPPQASRAESCPVEQENPPLCPLFGECGGCFYQHVSYATELALKEKQLKDLFGLNGFDFTKADVFVPIHPSPQEYHYRNRLDLKLLRTKDKRIHIGFSPFKGFRVVPVEQCFIARQEINAFLPTLKQEAIARLPEKYRLANLVVRVGEEGPVRWGGIGRRSLQLKPEDYFRVRIGQRKIFYSLDTFFQVNPFILPSLFQVLRDLPFWDPKTIFYDLYGGVGLFGIGLIDLVKKVILIEVSQTSIQCAEFNKAFHQFNDFDIIEGKVEDHLPDLMDQAGAGLRVAMIDPPRSGLTPEACDFLSRQKPLNHMIYLSCHPQSLVRDLKVFVEQGWTIKKIIPFDFFPRTRHLETLVWMERG